MHLSGDRRLKGVPPVCQYSKLYTLACGTASPGPMRAEVIGA